MVTIHYFTIEHAYAGIGYLYDFLGPKDPQHSLDETVTAETGVRNSRKLVSVNGETGAQSRVSLKTVETVVPDPTVSATAATGNVNPDKLETPGLAGSLKAVPSPVTRGRTP